MTLPLIHAMAGAEAGVRARLRTIVENGDVDGLSEVQAAISHAPPCQSCAAKRSSKKSRIIPNARFDARSL